MKNTKTITITLPLALWEVLETLPSTADAGLKQYKGRKISNICALMITEQLEKIHKTNLSHLIA
jgi:hypothetical protein